MTDHTTHFDDCGCLTAQVHALAQDCLALKAEVAVKRIQVETQKANIQSYRLEAQEAQADYERLTGLLRARFPANPDGSLPDWKVEDVLAENARLIEERKDNPCTPEQQCGEMHLLCDWTDRPRQCRCGKVKGTPMSLRELKVAATVVAEAAADDPPERGKESFMRFEQAVLEVLTEKVRAARYDERYVLRKRLEGFAAGLSEVEIKILASQSASREWLEKKSDEEGGCQVSVGYMDFSAARHSARLDTVQEIREWWNAALERTRRPFTWNPSETVVDYERAALGLAARLDEMERG